MTAPSAFIELIRLIQDGDPVNEATINRVLRSLNTNDRYLLALIQSLSLGTAVYRRNALLDASVGVGMPVFFNSQTEQYEKAIAAATASGVTLTTSDSSRVWGIVTVKHTSTTGDILLQGYAEVDISAALAAGDTALAGLYFLSGSTAGRLTRQEPAVSVPVLQSDGLGGVLVRSSFADLYSQHQHHRFELVCRPSTNQDVNAGHVSVIAVDTDVEGWLPADNAIFDGNAPAGAAFGYNLSASLLANGWPPLPLDGVHAEWFDGAVTLPPISAGLLVVDQYGIWWMSDCENFVPWPSDFDSATTTTTPSPTACPPALPMTLTLWYTQPKFLTTGMVVNSLRAAENSLITIRCLDNNSLDATTGNLEIDVDLNLLLAEATDTAGHIVLKGLNEAGEFTRGPVVSKLKPGAGNVILASTDGADGDGYHVGAITLSVTQNALGGELPIQNIKLLGAEEESYEDVLALGLPQNRLSAYRGEVQVPYDIGLTDVDVSLRFWFLARAGGTLPALTLTARVIPRPNTVGTLPTSDSAVTLTMPGTVLTEDQYVQVTSDVIAATAGASIQFTLTRDDTGGGDGFNGDVHVIKQHGVIVS